MAYVADLHIHSRFSRACSRDLNIPNLAKWSQFKGIDLMGTGDCLHPLWLQELKSVLKPNAGGFYQYGQTKFIPTVEVACIYTEAGKPHRIHILLFLPSLEAAFKLSEVLTKRGMNLTSDGRPIFGMTSKQLCELVFQVEPETLIVPAHCWTPWFSLFGSESGYDRFKDCFGEYSDEIFGIETGLSSEPAMNWRVGDLDKKSILSFSDAHSLPRLGREVTIFGGDPVFKELRNDLINQNIIGTIEFFPEEGKYHYSGHRNCGVVYSPEEIEKRRNPSNPSGQVCPVCKRKLTVGVMQRVEELATRKIEDLRLTIKDGITKTENFPKRAGFRMLVQLEEIIAEAINSTVSSQKTKDMYLNMVTKIDTELKILTKTSIEDIAKVSGEKVAEGIKRVREGRLSIEPGYDNTYGKVKIWNEKQEKPQEEQMELF